MEFNFSGKLGKQILCSLIFVVGMSGLQGCGEQDTAKKVLHFRSKSVQHQICIAKNGTEQERCEKFEKQQTMYLEIIEDSEDRVWLSGIDREGEASRLILGTKDQNGDYLFIDEVVDENSKTKCTLKRRLTLSLKAEQDIVEECNALVGREVLEVHSSSACDQNVEIPAQYTRYIRKRWQKDASCGKS